MYVQKCTANIAVRFFMMGENYVSECVYVCRESGSRDEKGSFIGKGLEMLERIIERGRFL